ncbi:hypothetical protein THC_0394 [Caldimicrobium thiodismutans]|uniref:Uncharacterized protein n=1 Tax=Caldimicrobium thiodismutans TaxID=1653476 RepID=A0A0U4N0P0_9BACT|nr:hypothetical protein [Caldimicrobium thiodismutans]BAU22790.1 hypothetical protein THC_0394 [Caldimicrobium thiodismutans]
MKLKVFLYPQSLFYPPKILKSLDHVEEFFLIKLIKTRERIQKRFPQLLSKIKFLNFSEKIQLSEELLSRVLEEMQNLALYLRTPDALRLYHLHQDLFEEAYPLFPKKKAFNSPIEKAYLLLSIAEELDENLLEVAFSLKNFITKWQEFFEEKILFKDETMEDLSSEGALQEIEVEELWEIEKRIRALQTLLPFLNWQEAKDLKTLLITEASILEELKDGEELIEDIDLTSGLNLLKIKGNLNKKIGLPKSGDFPLFQQILFVA